MTKRCLHCFVRIHALFFFSPPREIDSVCPSACQCLCALALGLSVYGLYHLIAYFIPLGPRRGEESFES